MTLGDDDDTWRQSAARWVARARLFFDSLAGRLLALTAAVVLAGEVLVFAPALASFHEEWLRDRINLAQIAALALEVSPDFQIAEELRYELLTNAGVQRVAMQRDGERELILDNPNATLTGPLVTYDYVAAERFQRFLWGLETFLAPRDRTLRVLARPRFESGEFIEIVLSETPLKSDMGAFALRFIFFSTLILMVAGALVYIALTIAFVRPMGELTKAIERFRDRPEDASIAFVRSRRADEIGRAERAAADMAEQIRLSLRQRERLAALGAAVARIGHDLRNMLSTAQIVTDRLSTSEDPGVRQIAPRLERAIDRAATLAATTLRYGRADEAAPVLKQVRLADAAWEAAADALAPFPGIACTAEIEPELEAMADPDHLHRILVNLIRNAAQAMQGRGREAEGIVIRGDKGQAFATLELEDHGPGVPEPLRERLFAPFVSADRQSGGAGLGLAIARELARSMGGDVVLMRSSSDGAVFQLSLRLPGG